jgi:hypothetical protein
LKSAAGHGTPRRIISRQPAKPFLGLPSPGSSASASPTSHSRATHFVR